jgi:hypothetical protein
MRERNRPGTEAPKPMREGVFDFEGAAPHREAMNRSALDRDAPEGAKDAAPIDDDALPASLYERTINLRYWGAALLGGALLWGVIFTLL